MSILSLTETAIQSYSSEYHFEQGQLYYQQGAVSWLIQRGDTLYSEVKGYQSTLHYPMIQLYEGTPVSSRCTCRIREGYCEHIIATLLKGLYAQANIEQRPTLEQLLADRTPGELQTLITTVVNQQPRLLIDIEEQLLVLLPTRQTPLVQIENHQFREKIRMALSYGFENDLCQQLLVQVSTFLHSGELNNTLKLLALVTEEAIQQAQQYKKVWDYDQDEFMADFFMAIDKLWATIFLSASLTSQQLTYWQNYLQSWQTTEEEASPYFKVALAVLQYGWDYWPLQEVLQGERQLPVWELTEDLEVRKLVEVYLHLLSEQQRYREFLALAKVQQHHFAYVWMLFKLERKTEAMQALMSISWQQFKSMMGRWFRKMVNS